ncbi:MAG: hypothetical protein AAB867_00740 [Patescibacteria group bacterium]
MGHVIQEGVVSEKHVLAGTNLELCIFEEEEVLTGAIAVIGSVSIGDAVATDIFDFFNYSNIKSVKPGKDYPSHGSAWIRAVTHVNGKSLAGAPPQ